LKIQKLAVGAQKRKGLDLHGHAYPEQAATAHSERGTIGMQNYSLELMSTAFDEAGYSGGKRFAASRASRSESFLKWAREPCGTAWYSGANPNNSSRLKHQNV
jgi:hypothetical protein